MILRRAVRALLTPALLSAFLIVAVQLAPAQYQIRQDGRLFDANPQIGSGGFNSAIRPTTPFLAGNAIATGNVRGGQSLRSFSPISNRSAFRTELGTSTLNDFRRDSVSLFDLQASSGLPAAGGQFARGFLDPAVVAPSGLLLNQRLRANVGAIFASDSSGFIRPLGQPIDTRLGTTSTLQPLGTTRGVGDTRLGADGLIPSRLGSRLPSVRGETLPGDGFGRRFGAPGGAGQSGGARIGNRDAQTSPSIADRLRSEGAAGFDPTNRRLETALDTRIETPIATRIESPLGTRLSGLGPDAGVNDLLTGSRRGMDIASDSGTSLGGIVGRDGFIYREPVDGLAGDGVAQDSSVEAANARITRAVLPGADVFTDLQLALELEAAPDSAWFREMASALDAQVPEGATSVDRPEMDPEMFRREMLETPLATFAGGAETPFNELLREAEALMTSGDYFDAANRYSRAATLAPYNPLPQLGRAHALLAAGDYYSAARALVGALETHPELTRLRIDLTLLLGGGEIVDIRRADIRQRLENSDDPRLRFLLGYLEYYTNFTSSGLREFEQAAATAPPGSFIARFPHILKQSNRPASDAAAE